MESLLPVAVPILRALQVTASTYSLWLASTSALHLNSYMSSAQTVSKVDPTGTVDKEVAKTTQVASIGLLSSAFGFASLMYIVTVARNKPGIVGYLSLFNTFLACLSYSQIRSWLNPSNKAKTTETKGRGKGLTGVGPYMKAWQRMEKLKGLQLTLGGMWTLSTMLSSSMAKA